MFNQFLSGIHSRNVMRIILLLSSALIIHCNALAAESKAKVTVGLLERIAILPKELIFDVKVDTGATNSSMHATDIQFYNKGDKEYVRFKTKDSNGRSDIIELPLLKVVRIKQHGRTKSQRRPVVEIGICLHSVYKTAPVTLTDRSRFKFPFLVGASYLKRDFLVDVSLKNTKKPSCDLVSEEK